MANVSVVGSFKESVRNQGLLQVECISQKCFVCATICYLILMPFGGGVHLKVYLLPSTHTTSHRPSLCHAVPLCELGKSDTFSQLQSQVPASQAKVPSGEEKAFLPAGRPGPVPQAWFGGQSGLDFAPSSPSHLGTSAWCTSRTATRRCRVQTPSQRSPNRW